MENLQFEDALRKIAPDEAETLKEYFYNTRRRLQDSVAFALTLKHETEFPKEVKERFDSASDNLNYIEQFVIEEAAKLKGNDPEKRREIAFKYIELLGEIGKQTNYLLYDQSIRDSFSKEQEELKRLLDEVKKIKEDYRKTNPEPTEEELREIWDKYIEPPSDGEDNPKIS